MTSINPIIRSEKCRLLDIGAPGDSRKTRSFCGVNGLTIRRGVEVYSESR
jgi:hypothetical protein